MPTASLEEIKAQVSTGEYAVGSSEVAAAILTKFELVRRVRPLLMTEYEARQLAGRASPSQRRHRSEPEEQPKPRRERLS